MYLLILTLPEAGVWRVDGGTFAAASGQDTVSEGEILRAVGETFSEEELDFRTSRSGVRRAGRTVRFHGRGQSRHSRGATPPEEERDHRLSARITLFPSDDLVLGARWDDCLSGPPVGPRLVSGFARASVGRSLTVTAGDYSVESGQGLLFWSPSLYRQSSGGSPRTPRGIVPVAGSGSTRSLRGIAVNTTGQLLGSAVHVTLFLSERWLRGSLAGGGLVGAINQMEPGEILTERSVRMCERMVGGAVAVENAPGLLLGLAAFTSLCSQPLSSRWLALPGRMRMAGAAASLSYAGEGLSAAGEVARFPQGGMSGCAAASVALASDITLSALFRARTAGTGSRHGSPVGYAPEGRGEKGCGLALELFPRQRLAWSLALDQSAFELSEGGPRGNRLQALLAWTLLLPPAAEVAVSLRHVAADELVIREIPGMIPRWGVDRQVQTWIRGVAEFRLGTGLRLRARLDATALWDGGGGVPESGTLLAQEFRWRAARSLHVEASVLLYSTASYDTRLYRMESGAPRDLSLTPHYGRGERWSIAVRWAPAPLLVAAMRIRRSHRQEGVVGLLWHGAYEELEAVVELDVAF